MSDSPPLSCSHENDPRIQATVAAVDWDALASVACSVHGAISSRWGNQISGGYNLIRFLHLDDAVVVARVPYLPTGGWIGEYATAFASQMSSEVATMRYIAAHSWIPVPRIIHHCVEPDGCGVGSPFMIMTKVDGVPLSTVWDDMDDAKRETVLGKVVDILLELASHRFDKIGMIFQREGENATNTAWYVAPTVCKPDETDVAKAMPSITFTSGVDYWITYANASLEDIRNTTFGSGSKIDAYCHAWFLRSLIPAFYDPSLDASGFPLCPGDFHSQNIMIADADTSPRLTAVIDWEFSVTTATSSFAQYPLFIVDHPAWEDDNPLRARNARDQATFNMLMREAEMKKDPTGNLPLSRAFANCEGVYMFEQAIQNEIMFSVLFPQLFAYVYGEEESFDVHYNLALMDGILKKEAQQFEKEVLVWKEAFETLGPELVSRHMSRNEFGAVLRKHRDRFQKGQLVSEWLMMELV